MNSQGNSAQLCSKINESAHYNFSFKKELDNNSFIERDPTILGEYEISKDLKSNINNHFSDQNLKTYKGVTNFEENNFINIGDKSIGDFTFKSKLARSNFFDKNRQILW